MAYFIQLDIYSNRRLIFIIFLMVFFALSPLGLALDPQKKITQYMHDTWRIEQGLPQNMVNAVVRTSDGYLWLGAEEGLVRFDGVHFEVYDKNKVEQIANNTVLAFYEDRQGNLWTGTHGGGLICLDAKDKKFTAYSKKQGLSNDRVRTICEDRQGNLWIGTDHGLNCLKEGKFTVYTTREGLSNNNIEALYQDRAGNLWIGTYGGGLDRMNRQDFPKKGMAPIFTSFTTEDGLSNDYVLSIYEDRKGCLWIGTYNGLSCMEHGKFTGYSTKNGLSDGMVRCINEDRQ
jgi:ligand-binding sensor domain-containing protein